MRSKPSLFRSDKYIFHRSITMEDRLFPCANMRTNGSTSIEDIGSFGTKWRNLGQVLLFIFLLSLSSSNFYHCPFFFMYIFSLLLYIIEVLFYFGCSFSYRYGVLFFYRPKKMHRIRWKFDFGIRREREREKMRGSITKYFEFLFAQTIKINCKNHGEKCLVFDFILFLLLI